MTRPAGEPGALAAGTRALAAAAGALGDVRHRLRGATSFVADAGAWRGPASEAFLVDGAGFQAGLARAGDALDQVAGALAELAARLEHAQATWDRARRLAAVVGVDLGSGAGVPTGAGGSPGGAVGHQPGSGGSPAGGVGRSTGPRWTLEGDVRSPVTAVDPAAAAVAGEARRMAEAAEVEAAAARRVAAARLARVGDPPAGGRRRGGAPASPAPPPPGGDRAGEGAPAASGGRPAAGAGDAAGRPGHRRDPGEGLVERAVNQALELGAEVATATDHLVRAAETRAEAAARLAAKADDPAVRMAARRVVETAGRPLVDGTALGALPLTAPVLELAAAMREGEPLPRALAGALGSAIGADLGGRAGLAACGGEAAVTEGAGLIICPTLTAVGGALGAQAGRAAALHVYDEIAGPPADHSGTTTTTGNDARAAADPDPQRAVRSRPGPGG